MSGAVEVVLEGWRATDGGNVVLENATYWLSAKMGVHGQALATALADDFLNPPAPPVDDTPQTQAQLLAAARALVGRIDHAGLRALEDTIQDAIDSSCAAPIAPVHAPV
jgi:hypothetical protein